MTRQKMTCQIEKRERLVWGVTKISYYQVNRHFQEGLDNSRNGKILRKGTTFFFKKTCFGSFSAIVMQLEYLHRYKVNIHVWCNRE